MFSKRCIKAWEMAIAAAIALVLAGCGGNGGGDGNGGDGIDTGSLRLSVTDGPVDEAKNVFVRFIGVEIQPQSGERLTYDFPVKEIDLLALQGNESELLLDQQDVPAGPYNWIRLILADDPGEIVLLDDSVHPLRIPSGNQTGLQLNRGFTVAAGGMADFTIEFDLRKSVHYPPGLGGDYILRPTLRLVDNLEIGSIAGVVDPSLLGEPPCAAVLYVFTGPDIVPDDIDGNEPDPITSALVDTATLTYVVGFLAPGDYTVALTCNAADDNPEQDDPGVTFISSTNATVTADTETMLDFEALAAPLAAPLPPPLPAPLP